MVFKAGQKVVFNGKDCINPFMTYPQVDDIVIIDSYYGEFNGKPHYALVGFLKASNGKNQYFDAICLSPLDHAFGEQLATELEQEINEEQLIYES